MNNLTTSFLHSRVRLASVQGPESRPAESPLRQQSQYAAGPYLEASLPHWAALTLERSDLSRRCSSIVSSRRATQATYVLHVLQTGHLQIRTLMPTSFGGTRRLFEHAVVHGSLNIAFDIDETSQVLELLTGLDRKTASIALALPQVQMCEAIVEDEANLLASLACVDGAPSLIPDQQVLDLLVVHCGDAFKFLLDELEQGESVSEAVRMPLH